MFIAALHISDVLLINVPLQIKNALVNKHSFGC